MRRSSMKLSAVTEHNTDPNMIITIVSIGRELLPRLSMYQILAAGAFIVGHAAPCPLGEVRRNRSFLLGNYRPEVDCRYVKWGGERT
jgi:hypothetical protein